MLKRQEKKKPVCPKCGRKTIYFRLDGSVRCTGCGYNEDRGADAKEQH